MYIRHFIRISIVLFFGCLVFVGMELHWTVGVFCLVTLSALVAAIYTNTFRKVKSEQRGDFWWAFYVYHLCLAAFLLVNFLPATSGYINIIENPDPRKGSLFPLFWIVLNFLAAVQLIVFIFWHLVKALSMIARRNRNKSAQID